MILSHRQIEEIAVAVTKDFNEFFFGPDTEEARLPRGTPIDQFARDYLGLDVSFAPLSPDGSITVYRMPPPPTFLEAARHLYKIWSI